VLTKIVATLGPATDTLEQIRNLVQAGADVFRLNASHGTQDDHARRIRMVRQVEEELGLHIGILLDLQGPKIRLGTFEGGGATLSTGTQFRITTDASVSGSPDRASTTYKDFVSDVIPGNRVLLADGAVELRCTDKTQTDVLCDVVHGGTVYDRQGINLPGVNVSAPSLSKKDIADLRFGLEQGVDMVALSFVRRREDVLRLRVYLEEADSHVFIVSKIEKPEAWDNLDAIIDESDGVMVARGDLGVEMDLERVPFVQKSIIERARKAGKFVITATQMLESMVHSPVPTRAEVSDVANAIYDGTDAVMLSAETSKGEFPVKAVSIMARIAQEADDSLKNAGYRDLPRQDHALPSFADTIAEMAYRSARLQEACAIVVFSASGASARLVSKFRPPARIYAFTHSTTVARKLSVIYGVTPIISPAVTEIDEMVKVLDKILLQRKMLKPRDHVIFVAGQPVGRPGTTNLIKLHRMGELW
jgi:pyruvate kinase